MTAIKGVAIVTGAAQGIGRAIALKLADDGFDVAVNGKTARKDILEILAQEITAKGRRSLVVVADVSIEGEVKAMVETVVNHLGALDVMVANAGVSRIKSIVDTTGDELDLVHATNVRGTLLCYKYAAMQMITQGRGGRIVGAGSTLGKEGDAFAASYCASKFAIRGLTQAAAKEFGKYGITVNAYAPGPIDTPMMAQADAIAEELGIVGGGPPVWSKFLVQRSCVGYGGTPTEVASLVSYIVSKEAHFITGQSILCDGGIHFD